MKKARREDETLTCAEKIASERRKKGLSVEDVSKKLGVSEEEYLSWENGSAVPDSEAGEKLAKLFHITQTELFWGRDARAASMTIFPKDAKAEYSVFADWRIFIGAILALLGIGGAMFLILRSVSEGYNSISEILAYCGKYLAVFGVIALVGIIICTATAIIRKKHRRK